MRFDFLNDTANDMLELCQRAKDKKENYIKSLGRKVSKKEDDELTEKFVQEEYLAYLESKQQIEEDEEQENDPMEYPDITKDYPADSLEFDELQDMLDDDLDDF